MNDSWNWLRKRLQCTLALALVFATGCATSYSGRMPNLNAKGAEAQKELEKFRFKERSFWTQGYWFQIEQQETAYTPSSMRSLLAHVSPRAAESLDSARCLRNYSLVFTGAGILSLVAALIADSGTSARSNWALSSLGFSLTGATLGMISIGHIRSATRQYNQDLGSRLGVQTAETQTGLSFALHY